MLSVDGFFGRGFDSRRLHQFFLTQLPAQIFSVRGVVRLVDDSLLSTIKER